MDYLESTIGEAREPGARRRKIADFLRSANEARQNYFQGGDSNPWNNGHGEDNDAAFPDASVVRGGGLEMILFPSYAKQWTKPTTEHVNASDGNDADYWRQEWARHEETKGVVEVDIRGWIYTPQRGPASRRQRLMIGLARQLSGIAAPPTSSSTESSQRPSRAGSRERVSRQEEDLIQFEAEQIVQKGRIEAEFAHRGVFSEQPGRSGTDVGTASSQNRMQSNDTMSRHARLDSYSSEDSGNITPVQKRDSWPQPTRMSTAELIVANRHLLHRLRPFMATPAVESQVKAFFYNNTTSRQKTVNTNPSGHFSLRTTLDFVPTHVRVVAGSDLSATEEVMITSPTGVSLISDIDDTIKHSAISMGAREIFRNAFIRDLADLTIEGVQEWYTRLHDMGVKLHYVSNSPWQMYPILTSFFKIAGLPRGSFHLKQYSGMLQGIFEPVAERKKSNLDRIMRDFPNRKFILVGDSGEADLEVYTEVVLEHPGRILGVFIRDVTSTAKTTGYFDASGGSPGRRSRRSSKSNDGLFMTKRSRATDSADEDADIQAAISASLADVKGESRHSARTYPDSHSQRPSLPARAPSSPLAQAQMSASAEEDLIDLSDQMPGPWISAQPWGPKVTARRPDELKNGIRATSSPPPPKKPDILRSVSPAVSTNSVKQPPPMPRKPSTAVRRTSTESITRPGTADTVRESKIPPPLPPRRKYRDMAMEKIGSVVSSTTIRDGVPIRQRPTTPRASTNSRIDAPRPLTARSPILGGQRHPDFNSIPDSVAIPQRRIASSGSLSALRNRMSSTYSDDGLPGSPGEAGVSKKELLWMQRLAKAKSILDRQGVMLRTWRTGVDAQEISVQLVQTALKEFEAGKK